MSERFTILGGKVHIYRRPNSSSWQCASFLAGKNRRTTTKEDSLSKAKEVAEDWYLQLRGKLRDGELKSGKLFREAAKLYLREFDIMTQGQRSATYARGQHARTNGHLVPFFGSMVLPEITAGKINEYRIHRLEECKVQRGKPPAHNTMHQEIVTLRQIFKTALRHGWIDHLPDLSAPYRASAKISHRAWFSPEEYKQLYEATRKRAHDPKQPRFRWEAEQLHDYVLFSANTGLRPDEAMRLEFRDVTVVEDEGSGQTILEIEVRGKRGVGYCKSTAGAVHPFERLKTRTRPNGGPGRSGSRTASIAKGEWHEPGPTDLLFPKWPRDLFNAILDEEKLRTDRDGRPRTAYSLRHTYICLRLLEGADIYQIAKNCRTSVEMIEKYYAAHLKTRLDASAINIMRPRPKNKATSKKGPGRVKAVRLAEEA
ncbi:site-specific integrase [Granulicella arctica]|uniref:phage integrase SAM-like domain-containing protein n=1 Tax=Granulicella arctica TaxID=940613 RepID=UPI0021E014C7|nr:phage integrase SAM-like domain-containing protein [Granulicella arctica]